MVLNIESNSWRNSIRFDYENRPRAICRIARSQFLLLSDNAKLEILFYCHEAGKITYGWILIDCYFNCLCRGRKSFGLTLRFVHSAELRLCAMPCSERRLQFGNCKYISQELRQGQSRVRSRVRSQCLHSIYCTYGSLRALPTAYSGRILYYRPLKFCLLRALVDAHEDP
jgi:hypothetical protein